MKKLTAREALALVRKDHIGFAQLWFTDVLGFLKGVTIPIAQLPRALEDGMEPPGA